MIYAINTCFIWSCYNIVTILSMREREKEREREREHDQRYIHRTYYQPIKLLSSCYKIY